MWQPDFENPILDRLKKQKNASIKKHILTCAKNKSKRKRR